MDADVIYDVTPVNTIKIRLWQENGKGQELASVHK